MLKHLYPIKNRESWDILQQVFHLINVSPHNCVCWHVNHKSWRLYQSTHATLRYNFSYYHGMFSYEWSLRFCLLVFCASFLVPGGAFISCQLWCMRKGLLSTKQYDKKPDSSPVPKKRVKWLKLRPLLGETNGPNPELFFLFFDPVNLLPSIGALLALSKP